MHSIFKAKKLGNKMMILVLGFLSLTILEGFTQTWNPLGPGLNDEVYSMIEYDGDLIVAGDFTAAGATTINKIGRWDGSSWYPFVNSINGRVHAMEVHGGDLYIVGNFTNINGQSFSRIARWNGSSWHALGTGANGNILAVKSHNNDLYIGGTFTSVGGVSGTSRVARWNGASWNSVGGGVTGFVMAIEVYNGNVIFAGDALFAPNAGASRIARWNGSAWSNVGGGMYNGNIRALQVHGTDLYIGGSFTSVNGSVGFNNLARFDGTNWNDVYNTNGTGVGVGIGGVLCFSVHKGFLYIGGGYNWPSPGYILRKEGNNLAAVTGGLNNDPNTLTEFEGALVAGGIFTQAGGNPALRIAQLQNALPINMVSFDVIKNENHVILNWSVDQVGKFDLFRIERSLDGIEFQEIGVKDAGDIQNDQGFQWRDYHPVSNKEMFYRIRLIDGNGAYSLSKIQSIKLPLFSAVEIFPNPASDWIFIKSSNQVKSVILYDLKGQVTRNYNGDWEVNSPFGIDVHDLTAGVYVVMIFHENGLALRRKVAIGGN